MGNRALRSAGIDIGYGLTKNGAKNPDAWKFLASLVRGAALQEALNDLNDLPAVKGLKPQGDISPNINQMYDRFMADFHMRKTSDSQALRCRRNSITCLAEWPPVRSLRKRL